METIKYKISGFKCFNESTFEINNITVLTGSNGTGKSSFIQALLLIRTAIERNCANSKNVDYVTKIWKNTSISLNGPFAMNLGSFYDIFNEGDDGRSLIEISLGNEKFTIEVPSQDDNEEERIHVNLISPRSNNRNRIPFWRQQKFYYLNTERLGPRMGVNSIYTDFPHCYFQGENTGQVIYSYGWYRVNDQRRFPNSKNHYLVNQIDEWLQDICPGTQGVKVVNNELNRFQILMRTSGAKDGILAPNIGFGISYALPVIVNGLIAEKDSVFIVENPEAHLHPKGQSKMGYFLGLVAASGVRVVIETHSEHIVNGIRRASLSNNLLRPEDVGIYFFGDNPSKHGNAIKIAVGKDGGLDSFPKDFFDQVGQDMAELFRLKRTSSDG